MSSLPVRDRGRRPGCGVVNPDLVPVASSAPYHDALERCIQHWALVPEKTMLVRDGANHVFASEDSRGTPVIVRVSDGDVRTHGELLGELLWLGHLRERGCTVAAPIRSLGGDLVETTALASGTFHVSCFERFAGRLIDPKTDPAWNAAPFEKLGRAIGRVHRASDTLELAPQYDRKPWFELNVFQFPTPVPDEFDRATVAAMQAFLREMRARPKTPRHYGLVHGDLHAGNFLYEDGTIELIDFDFGAYGWRVMDFVSLLFIHYYFPSKRVPDASPKRASEFLAGLVRGYRQEYGLDPEQLDAIGDLMKVRSILNYIAMAPSPDHWQVALGNPTPTVQESLAWIERLWSDGTAFEIALP